MFWPLAVSMAKDLGIIGTVGRFKPVHLGHHRALEWMCRRADHVCIGLGSPNKRDLRNPFSARESADMIAAALAGHSNYTILEVPDLDNRPKWREQILRLYGSLDHFVTANDYVAKLLGHDYDILHPSNIIPRDEWVYLNATMVREAMARGAPWDTLVPGPVAAYLSKGGLVDRFRREFGLKTLAQLASSAGGPP